MALKYVTLPCLLFATGCALHYENSCCCAAWFANTAFDSYGPSVIICLLKNTQKKMLVSSHNCAATLLRAKDIGVGSWYMPALSGIGPKRLMSPEYQFIRQLDERCLSHTKRAIVFHKSTTKLHILKSIKLNNRIVPVLDYRKEVSSGAELMLDPMSWEILRRYLQIVRLHQAHVVPTLGHASFEVHLYEHYHPDNLKKRNIDLVLCLHGLLRGLKFIHSASIIHCDIRPENVRITCSRSVQITGFNLARSFDPTQADLDAAAPLERGLVLENVETRWYRAPECIIGVGNWGPACDMWSVGCILAELLGQEPLFRSTSYVDQLNQLIRILGTPSKVALQDNYSDLPLSPHRPLSERFRHADSTAVKFLADLLRINPKKRITCEAALGHELFSKMPQGNSLTHLGSSARGLVGPQRGIFEFALAAEDDLHQISALIKDEVKMLHNLVHKSPSYQTQDHAQNVRSKLHKIWRVIRASGYSSDQMKLETNIDLPHTTTLDTSRTMHVPPSTTLITISEISLRADDPKAEFIAELERLEYFCDFSTAKAFVEWLQDRQSRIHIAAMSFGVCQYALQYVIVLVNAYVSEQLEKARQGSWRIPSSHVTQVKSWYHDLCQWMEENACLDPVTSLVKSEDIARNLEHYFHDCPRCIVETTSKEQHSGPLPQSNWNRASLSTEHDRLSEIC
ncbi:hypothetical protein CERSUDRAFT_121929 [Gelatoporia subvermispora B]|uniref:Protein kinase domain-containing protein n=1 Tax=Ceriporiopsis subvermispora (strain B) TaxID=914234 RepID=M2QRK7_CERS8|nr:hypothetical protein CERSUDRAFT_121929 [Gelatoporia subvermispora B]